MVFFLLPPFPGVYVLVLNIRCNTIVSTRGSKSFRIDKGYYLYIGSARGRGGIRARVTRHLRKDKKLFWHIDYLLSNNCVKVAGVYYKVLEKNIDLESIIAERLVEKLEYIEGFGCSDKKRDKSHLFRCGSTLEECRRVFEEIINIGLKYVSLNQTLYKP